MKLETQSPIESNFAENQCKFYRTHLHVHVLFYSIKHAYASPYFLKYDGITTVSQYTLQEILLEPLYTKFLIDIPGPTSAEEANVHFEKEFKTIVKTHNISIPAEFDPYEGNYD